MKVCVLNFSGNVGKSTIAAHLLQPRLNAQVFSVESLNVDASSDGVEVARLRGKHYNDLLQRLMKLDDAIVDVGSSNVEDFLKMMQHYADSQEEFDLFVVPVVKDGKTTFPLAADAYAAFVGSLAKAGANFIGGCCGTTPAHIAAVRKAVDAL